MNALLGIFGFALATAFVPWWSGAGTSPRWLVAAMAGAACLFVQRAALTYAHLWGGAFVGWALLSFAWSDARLDWFGGAGRLAIASALFLLGSGLRDLTGFYKGAALGLAVSGVIAVAALLGLPLVPQRDGGIAGLFVNPILYAEAAGLIASALLAVPGGLRWQICLLPALLSRGRGAAIAFCGAWAAYLGQRGMWVALAFGFLMGGALIAGLYAGWLPTGVDRLWIWRDTFSGGTPLGHGIGSFGSMFPLYADHANPVERHAHSMLLEAFFETGYVGFALAVGFLSSLLIDTPRSPEKLLLIAFTMDGLYAFPDQTPFTFAAAALAAGHLSRSVALVRGRRVLV